ncbi:MULTISPECIES: alpha/beta hydrolase-fold protein [unclassified Neisseria]|uniref:alpha/beta hydrolase-fold protein n=1 Tax=unclassified Neisseria TaxID=2623750 RepID=UPI00107196E6|nr:MULTISPECIES: alpha/beta hydrolase-fold protein [unclassified Neisseria]MBF0804100.1 S-formylglutathione hydrolase [Neisseria sp. 19428wB4_WF04]TFU43179.1 S-formylglutathione hydrolase [Neisseria sp. WF04]
MSRLTLVSRNKMFNGSHERYRHFSERGQCEMTFAVYLPPQVLQGYRVPVLYWLPGLACAGENFPLWSGAARFAAQWGIALVIPDAPVRGAGAADSAGCGLGQGAGFDADALCGLWAAHYQMCRYIENELPALIEAHFPANGQRSIAGHGIGGYGALQTALSYPKRYAAVSAFAPVTDPAKMPWGQKAVAARSGGSPESRAQYGITELVQTAAGRLPVLIDQGSVDEFYPHILQPQPFVDAARGNGFNVQFNLREGYGHNYDFIATFIDSHIEFHADALGL